MPVNPGIEYLKAEREYVEARTDEEKLNALNKMLQTCPKHKGSEKLQKNIKEKIAKLKQKKEKLAKLKKSGFTLTIKKEGAATICLVGTTNTGKSTLLKKLTNANVEIAPYPFTTKKPEVGMLDYKGIKLQIIEIPSIVENFEETEQGPTYFGLIRQSDLIILFFNTPKEKRMLDVELENANIDKPILIFNDQENIKDEIWKRLNLIKIYTKQPGKEKDYPPVALKKGSTVKTLAEKIHKDFIKRFKFSRIFGKSVKFSGTQVSLNHQLEDDDVVELHLR